MNNNLKKVFLILGDILVLYVSLYLALLIRNQGRIDYFSWSSHFWPFTLIFIFWLLVFYISNLYNLLLAVNNSKFFQRTLQAIAIAGLISVAFFYLNPNISIAPKTNLLIFLIIVTLLFLAWRRFYNWSLSTYLPKNNLTIIGYNELVKELVNALNNNPHLGYRIKSVFDNGQINLSGVETISDINQLKNHAITNKIASIILASDPHNSEGLQSALFSCLPLKVNIINLSNFYEQVTGKVPIETINQIWFFENLSEGSKTFFDVFKKIYDLLLAGLILLITAPFWPLIGIIIKLESRGPVFFKQVRAGKDNKLFTIIKFRTMTEDNNDRSPTTVADRRVTSFGYFIRKIRLDEIPQVLNVLMGDMSFVGPRPEQPELIAKLEKEIPFYKERMLVKPGLTGWDQISGEYHSPSREDTLKKLQYDLFYIKNRSLYLDLTIILKTIATVLSSAGV